MMTLAETLMPAWFVLPVATVVLLVLTAHLLAVNASDMEARRRRIRTANNILMMLTTPLIAYGFGILDTGDGRRFVLVWTIVPLLLLLIVVLALADMLNTLVLHQRNRRSIRRGLADKAGGPGAGRAGGDA